MNIIIVIDKGIRNGTDKEFPAGMGLDPKWLFGVGANHILCGNDWNHRLGRVALCHRPASPPLVVSQNNEAVSDSGRVNRIAFVTVAGQIGTVAPDGNDSRLLTNDDARFYLFPAWSPDGQNLAAIGGDSTGGGVYLLADSPNQSTQTLYTSPDQSPFYLYWSPDGQRVSFLANHPTQGIGLHLALADGSQESLLATGQPFYWDWATNGQQLLIHTGSNDNQSRLAFLNVDGDGNSENIGQPGFFQAPDISYDGHYIAFAEVDNAQQRWLVIRNQESGESQRQAHFGAVALGWSPTANRLAYSSPAEADPRFFDAPYGPLHIQDGETGQDQVVTDKVVLAFFWSPDGQYLAYFTLATASDEINATRPEPTLGKRVQQNDVQLSLWLFTIADHSTRRLLSFTPTVLFATQFLPFFDQYALSHAIWSPANDALVLPTAGDEGNQIMVVPLDGSLPRPVAEGSLAFWSRN